MQKLFFALAFFLMGCQHKPKPMVQEDKNNLSLVKKMEDQLPKNFSIDRIMAMISGGKVKEAIAQTTVALQVSPKNPMLHLLAGLLYETVGQSEVASTAYRTARELDPTNWMACYMYGACLLKLQDPSEARKALSDAAILNSKEPSIWYELARASYACQDLPVAFEAIQKAQSLDPRNPKILRSSCIIASSMGKKNLAQKSLEGYKVAVGAQEPDVQYVQERMKDWDRVSYKFLRVAGGSLAEGLRGGDDGASFKEVKNTNNQTIVLDCIIIRSSAVDRTNKGSNIFEQTKPLTVVLGSTGLSLRSDATSTIGSSNPWMGTLTRTTKFGIDASSLTYSLAIMNASRTNFEVLVRPTLSTLPGKPAYFVSGEQYTGATQGSGFAGSTITSVDAGTKIEVLPLEVTPSGLVVMDVNIKGTLFTTAPEASKSASDQIFAVNQSITQTTVKAYFGQTVIVGGIYQRSNIHSKSGFPGLQDIPILQYFTSSSQTVSDSRCALCLITPRRGGESPEACRPTKKQLEVIARKLAGRGLMSLDQYSNTYYALKGIQDTYLFPCFRSGDLPGPFFGLTHSSLARKLKILKSFLWY